MSEEVFPDTHLTLACLATMAQKGNFQEHKADIADIMQSVLDLDRVVRTEQIVKEQSNSEFPNNSKKEQANE